MSVLGIPRACSVPKTSSKRLFQAVPGGMGLKLSQNPFKTLFLRNIIDIGGPQPGFCLA